MIRSILWWPVVNDLSSSIIFSFGEMSVYDEKFHIAVFDSKVAMCYASSPINVEKHIFYAMI